MLARSTFLFLLVSLVVVQLNAIPFFASIESGFAALGGAEGFISATAAETPAMRSLDGTGNISTSWHGRGVWWFMRERCGLAGLLIY